MSHFPTTRLASTLRSRLLAILLALSVPAWGDESPEPSTSAVKVEDDSFVDSSGNRVRFTPLYEGWFGADRYEPNYARAGVEHLLVFAGELAVYWFNPDQSVVDWQFPDLGSKLASREVIRFDDNLLQTNYLFHSFAGSAHYMITRSNGFGVPVAFTSTVASSALYEMLLEWKEIVSVNDLIVTPFGGMALGEFAYHFGNYLNSEPPVPPRDGWMLRSTRATAPYVFGVPRKLHEVLDEPPEPPGVPADNLGLSSAYAHRFRLLFGQEMAEDERGELDGVFIMRGDFELVAMPGFLRSGRFQRFFTNGNFTHLVAQLGYGNDSRDADFEFDAHLLGWYSQDLRATPTGRDGYAHEAAFYTGVRFVNQRFAGREEQRGIVHLFSPMQRVWLHSGPALFSFGVDVSPDFGSVHSAAYEAYAERFGRAGTKSSLHRHNYFHGWGLSAGASAGLSIDGFQVGARARYGHYESIDGLERVQEEVTFEPHGRETVGEIRAHVAFEPAGTPLAARFELEQVDRGSVLGSAETFRRTQKATVALGVHF